MEQTPFAQLSNEKLDEINALQDKLVHFRDFPGPPFLVRRKKQQEKKSSPAV